MEKTGWATVSLSCLLRKRAWTDSIGTSAAVAPLHQQFTANCSEERCAASPPACSELGSIPSFPLPYRVCPGKSSLDIRAVPFAEEREGCWKQLWCCSGGGRSRLPRAHTPKVKTALSTEGSRAEGRVRSLQPAPSPCTPRCFERRAGGSPWCHPSCLWSKLSAHAQT